MFDAATRRRYSNWPRLGEGLAEHDRKDDPVTIGNVISRAFFLFLPKIELPWASQQNPRLTPGQLFRVDAREVRRLARHYATRRGCRAHSRRVRPTRPTRRDRSPSAVKPPSSIRSQE